MRTSDVLNSVKRRVWRLQLAFVVAFGAVALFAVNWSVREGPAILSRADNPRQVVAELFVERGRILDANNVVLAETAITEQRAVRHYPLPGVAAAVGHYSIRYGTAGVEEAYDTILRGADTGFWTRFWEQDVLHKPQAGRDVRLTLDARWQQLADKLLGEASGVLLLFGVTDGSILALISHPSYDPNLLGEQFETLAADERGPLLNRVAQGQYQPGLVLQPFIIAAAVDAGLAGQAIPPIGLDRSVLLDGRLLSCAEGIQDADLSAHGGWAAVLAHRCPGPLAEIGHALGAERLLDALEAFGLDQPQIPDSAGAIPLVDPVAVALGESEALLSPIQVAYAWGALANGGALAEPLLVSAVQRPDGSWQRVPSASEPAQAVTAAAASGVMSMLPTEGGVVEHGAVVLSGPEEATNAWYLASAPAAAPRYGVLVLIEGSGSLDGPREIGRSLLRRVLDPTGP
jgi:penicillin-binding protein A